MKNANQPARYAVVGDPIAHSKSPLIQRLFAEQTGENLIYEAIKLDSEDGYFLDQINVLRAQGIQGLNITVPFKLDAFETADELTERAKIAQAVNTYVFRADGSILGDNTDGIGLMQDITENAGFEISGKKVLILGAGGAVQGIMQPLLELQPDLVHLANRTAKRAESIAARFAGEVEITSSGWDEIPGQGYDLIINGTAASLEGKIPPINPSVLGANSLVYDMMYGDKPTVFLEWAAEHQPNSQRLDGLGMLVGQAAQSFYLWRGVRPKTQPVIDEVRKIIAETN